MPEVSQSQAVSQSEAKQDQLTSDTTIYQASTWSILWRNFLAGMARALGGLAIYVLVFVVTAQIVAIYIWPTVEPMLNGYMSAIDNFNRMSQVQQQGAGQIDPQQIESLLDQFTQ